MASAQQRIKGALDGPLRPNPMLSAVQFANLTGANGGATMNVHTHDFTVSPGGRGYIVGGVTSQVTGKPVPAVERPTLDGRHPALDDVLRQTARIKRNFPTDRQANVGSWVQDGKVAFDASEVEHDPVRARRKMIDRDEDAIHAAGPGWDVTNHLKRKRKG